jgi:hypothetical protein
MMEMICYCFNYTDAEIVEDVVKHHGRSTIMERVIEARKNGTCECEIKNPKKR